MINLDGVVFWAGLTFLDTETIVPVLLSRLGASDTLIGMARFIQVIGYTLPALIAAHYIHGRKYHKRFLLTALGIQRVVVLFLPFAVYYLPSYSPKAAIFGIYFIMAWFWLLDGGAAVSWFDMVAKTVPAQYRGRFFGVMQSLGGASALIGGMLVNSILRNPRISFPTNYTIFATIFVLCMCLSQLFLSLIREPEGSVEEDQKATFLNFAKQAVPLLKRRPVVFKLVAIRLLLDGSALASPFYVLFAHRNLLLALSIAGVYAVSKQAGKLLLGPLWGVVTDRYGASNALAIVAICVTLVPLLALSTLVVGSWTLVPAFFILGGIQDGVWMTSSNVLLISITEQERPLAVGATCLLQSPSAMYGIIGGALAGFMSYQYIFAIAAGLTFVGCLVALSLSTNVRAWKVEVGETVG